MGSRRDNLCTLFFVLEKGSLGSRLVKPCAQSAAITLTIFIVYMYDIAGTQCSYYTHFQGNYIPLTEASNHKDNLCTLFVVLEKGSLGSRLVKPCAQSAAITLTIFIVYV